ncbi:cytochrome c [Paucibacter sp. R3-3]|uniref:Cytochrome c n=2 Tax=Roseateles agri TaxID=3098619 RepID=A0ABU5DMN8_9BURK|nr:cytochrome c [Paucibacter sp. R3-3]
MTALRPTTLPVLTGLLLLLAACAPQQGRSDLTTVAGSDPERGRRLMARYQCGSCHRAGEVFAAGGQLGPSLDRYGQRSYIAGELPNTPEMLQRWLLDPPGLLPGTAMPSLGITDDDARDMAGYLLSLR